MIHQNNPLSHFFNLHSATSATGEAAYRSDATDEEEIDVDDSVHNKCTEEQHTDTELDSASVGKSSFTIAAILGLKAAAAAANLKDCVGANIHSGAFNKPSYTSTFTQNHLGNPRPFNDVMSLTLNSSMKAHHQQQQHHSHPHHANTYEGLPMNRLASNQPFLANSFQHHAVNSGSALQNLQKLHQQHVAATNSLAGNGNGFRLMGRADLSKQSKTQSSTLKSKRVRTIFTPEQLERLEAEFERQQYMVGPERLYLAHTLQLTEAQVKVGMTSLRN